ncbi:hypothetical protein BCV72DRAFT_310162 [Rhizopus microsporus var. microsporus]|uniref:sn-1-specific diacylglycerol lipase n=2 Tax=Rhizopus microsporus TaxID=58291 RepID=A0A2G4SGD0_RHIZD|nr:uncharacterized protein RHIMIDRAFT_242323 [Rhizopus microsporus ATCC 52813]ORE01297.1 hypothetical protein BCV72DRAFT_310162 [Rhizopus microsporus var. microsporus]PHZ07822.1 hypothetical protein RHIMIDRAFT_242323 [Rhizopus microsporus ATCC 52813]
MEVSTQITTYSATLYNTPSTLLPEQIANVITAITLAARLSIRCSSLLIEALIESVKYSTSFSFGVSRHVIINALSTAKKFHELTSTNSLSIDKTSFLQVLDKYTNLGIYIVHHSFTLAELFALSGLHFTSQTIKSGLMAAEESVGIIDGIFGSNESSRAIASIITLVHNELVKDPEFKLAKIGKVAILSGLTKAITLFAIIQNFTHHRTVRQMDINLLWKGLVVEEERNEQSLIQFQSKQDNTTPSSSAQESSHSDIIHELEEILSVTPSEFPESNNQPSIGENEKEQTTVCLSYDKRGEPYGLYEITTTTKRTTTKTTRIRPIDTNEADQSFAKQIVEQTNEEENETFMAAVDTRPDTSYELTIPGAWPQTQGSQCVQWTKPQKKTGFKIMLSSISKKLARKKVERQTNYGIISPDDGHLDPTVEGSIQTVTSTSTTLRSTLSTSSSIHHYQQGSDNTEERPLPSLPGSSTSFMEVKSPPKRRKSWSGLKMKNIGRRKSITNLIQKGTDAFSSKKKKPRSNPPPPPLPSRRNSISSNSLRRSTSINSVTSLSSIARTLKTTTYCTTTPHITPTSSSRSLIRSPSVPSRLCPPNATSVLEMEPNPKNFPRKHIITNIAHFIRYASAAYGESFMRILGIGDIPSVLPKSHHPNHHAFAHHTGVSVSDILLSSYTDDSILSSLTHSKPHALVHYVTVDHFAEAIVLTCRGTLGLSDILTDLTCDYKEFVLPTDKLLYEEQKKANGHCDSPRRYIAHGGMLEAAQMMAVQKGKVFEAIKRGLEAYPNYGLVLCGHSLGAGVTSLLSILLSEERAHYLSRKQATAENEGKLLSALTTSSIKKEACPFVTSELSGLPAGRPIHCYTYGSPCVMSLALSEYCGQGLITSVVHGYDIVSSLSLGLLKDFKNVAVSLHEESHVADEILTRILSYYQKKKTNEITPEEEENEQWFWALIKTMRADMNAEKLFPPATTYLIEAIPQLAQHTQSRSTSSQEKTQESKHKTAYMVQFSLCNNIQARFSEIVFSKAMFMDHSPNMYEKAIKLLNKGYFS